DIASNWRTRCPHSVRECLACLLATPCAGTKLHRIINISRLQPFDANRQWHSLTQRDSPAALSLMVLVASSFLFPFCLVNLIEGMRYLVQKHQVRSTHTAYTFD